jgi:hypothetical protein
MKTTLRTAATALLLTTLVGSGLVGLAPSASAGTTVPFTAVFGGPVKAVPPNKIVFYDGSGSSNVMGPISTGAVATITGVSLSCLAGLVNTNVVTLTAADGSLTLTSQDVGCPVGVLKFHGTGVYTVTGGTGRYAGASGSGTLVGGADLLAGSSQITADGTLTMP